MIAMGLRSLFGKATSKAKDAEDYAQKMYDREVTGAAKAHNRGSTAVGEFGDRAFGMDRDDDDGPTPIDVALGPNDSMGGGDREMPDPLGGDGGGTPGVPDMMGERDTNDDEWYW